MLLSCLQTQRALKLRRRPNKHLKLQLYDQHKGNNDRSPDAQKGRHEHQNKIKNKNNTKLHVNSDEPTTAANLYIKTNKLTKTKTHNLGWPYVKLSAISETKLSRSGRTKSAGSLCRSMRSLIKVPL